MFVGFQFLTVAILFFDLFIIIIIIIIIVYFQFHLLLLSFLTIFIIVKFKFDSAGDARMRKYEEDIYRAYRWPVRAFRTDKKISHLNYFILFFCCFIKFYISFFLF